MYDHTAHFNDVITATLKKMSVEDVCMQYEDCLQFSTSIARCFTGESYEIKMVKVTASSIQNSRITFSPMKVAGKNSEYLHQTNSCPQVLNKHAYKKHYT